VPSGSWVDVTDDGYPDTTNKIICGTVIQLSPFAIFQLNRPPELGVINAPLDPVELGAEVSVTSDFSDPDAEDTHTAEWDWGDGTTSAGIVTETDGSGGVTGSHIYVEAGVYTVTLTVTDDDGGSDTDTFKFVVVYDPYGGFVTGGGWIDSPAGAYAPDPTLKGKATFGFVSKYKKGATTPTGNTEFTFKAGDLNFHSDSYDWLVIAGHKAKYKGTGTINGAGNYGFMLSAIDEKLTPSTDVDLFRIKIWDKDSGDAVVYDNQIGEAEDADPTTSIGGGSIVIHKPK
jgi:PKD repeat protein